MLGKEERPWWQICTEEAFKERLAVMGTFDLQELVNDVSTVIVKIEAHKQSPSPDADWKRRVRYAQQMAVARRRMIQAELASRNEANRAGNAERKHAWCEEMRAALNRGETGRVLHMMIDYFDPDVPQLKKTK